MENLNLLINNYYNWLKEKTDFKKISNYYKITTPYLDRHNDYIQIYLKKENDNFILTDDSYTIEDLIQSGCNIDTPNRKKLLQIVLNGYGVSLHNEELFVKANNDNFPLKKHNLIQAILTVNDMFYLTKPNIENLFFEDVKNWFDVSDIRYSERVSFMGHSGYPRMFDFLISKSKNAPERIIKTVNNPRKASADNIILEWLDTKEIRPENSKAYTIINNREKTVSSSIIEALQNYDITPIKFNEIDKYKQELAA